MIMMIFLIKTEDVKAKNGDMQRRIKLYSQISKAATLSHGLNAAVDKNIMDFLETAIRENTDREIPFVRSCGDIREPNRRLRRR